MLLTRLVDKHHGGFGLAKWLTFILEVISSLFLMALMLLTCGDVIGRYVFNNSINGTTELTELALGIIIFCQIPVVTIASTHVVVDILDRLLPSIFLRLSGVVSHLIVGVGFYYLADRIWFMAERSMRRGVFTEFLQIPVAYFIQFISIMMYFSAAVLIIVALRKLIKKDL